MLQAKRLRLSLLQMHLTAYQVVSQQLSCCAAWVLLTMGAFFYILKLLGYFRVNAADEAAGLDASHHGGSAYPVDLDDDNSHKGSSYDGKQYNKVSICMHCALYFCGTEHMLSVSNTACVARAALKQYTTFQAVGTKLPD